MPQTSKEFAPSAFVFFASFHDYIVRHCQPDNYAHQSGRSNADFLSFFGGGDVIERFCECRRRELIKGVRAYFPGKF